MELLRPSQVCKMLSVSRTWLFEATRAGRIPSVRLGDDGPVRYDPTELDAWLHRRGKDDRGPDGGASRISSTAVSPN